MAIITLEEAAKEGRILMTPALYFLTICFFPVPHLKGDNFLLRYIQSINNAIDSVTISFRLSSAPEVMSLDRVDAARDDSSLDIIRKGRAKMAKVISAFFLGLFAAVLVWGIGEAVLYEFGYAGIIATFILMAACFFICQFFLSRDNPDAYRRDWPIMSALETAPLLIVIFGLLWDRRMGVRVFISSLVGTLVGAAAASLAGRRKGRRPLE